MNNDQRFRKLAKYALSKSSRLGKDLSASSPVFRPVSLSLMIAALFGAHGFAYANSIVVDHDRYADKEVYGNTNNVNIPSNYEGSPDNNEITVDNNGKVYRAIGGRNNTDPVKNNKVLINSGAEVTNIAVGGMSVSGNVENNEAKQTGGKVSSHIIGGFIEGDQTTGSVINNKVILEGGTTVNIAGGFINSPRNESGAATGNANENTAIVKGGNVEKNVYGGKAVSGNANTNRVSVSGGTIDNNIYGGAVASGNGMASGNRVETTLSNQSILIRGQIYGGAAAHGNAQENIVNLSAGTINGNVVGGFSANGDAMNNGVNLSSVYLGNDVYGGRTTGSGSATKNIIHINDESAIVRGNLYGGHTVSGNVEDNEVSITGGEITGNVYGAYSSDGNSVNNNVHVTGGYFYNNIYGTKITAGNGSATNNHIKIEGGSTKIEGMVYGAMTDVGAVKENEVIVESGSIGDEVMGGASGKGEVINNTVKITGGVFGKGIYGGRNNGLDARVSQNQVTINGTADVSGGGIYGGYSGNGIAEENTVFIKDAAISNEVVGGYVGSGSGGVIHNRVTLDGNTNGSENLSHVYGGLAYSGSGNVLGNQVTLSGNALVNGAYGGYIDNGTGNVTNNIVNIHDHAQVSLLFGGLTLGNGDANGNVVNIQGGMIKGSVIGGSASKGTATGNTVNIEGSATFSDTVLVMGGQSSYGNDAFSGNTLNLALEVPLFAVMNFENINFKYGGNSKINYISTDKNQDVKIGITSGNTIDFAGFLSGEGAITKTGEGVLLLSNQKVNYSYRGGTTIKEGTLKGNIAFGNLTIAQNASFDGSDKDNIKGDHAVADLLGDGNIINTNGLWVYSVTNTEFGGSMDASNIGGLVKEGTATLTLSGDNRYLGGTVINQGVLRGNIPSGDHLTVNEEGIYETHGAMRFLQTLDGKGKIRNDDGVTLNSGYFAGVISGNGKLIKEGDDTVTLVGNNTYTGDTVIAHGTLKGGVSEASNLWIGANGIYDGADENNVNTARIVNNLSGNGMMINTHGVTVNVTQDSEFGGVLDSSNTGGLIKNGVATLTLTGNNTYTGDTVINEGILKGSIANNRHLIVNANAAYETHGFSPILQKISGKGAVINHNSITVDEGDFSGVMSGVGNLIKSGDGVLVLSGANTYTGSTMVRSGTLLLSGGSLASSELTLEGGAVFNATGATMNPVLSGLTIKNAVTPAQYIGDLSAQNATLNFYVPTTTKRDEILLNVEGNVVMDNATVNVGIDGSQTLLNRGERIVLIGASGTLSGKPKNSASGYLLSDETNSSFWDSIPAMQGVTLDLVFDLYTDPNRLLAELRYSSPHPQTQTISEGALSGTAFISEAADLVADKGLLAAQVAANERGLNVFGVLKAGQSNYKTGLSMKTKGLSLLTGVAGEVGNAALGAFIEYGHGHADTQNTLASRKVHGKDNLNYLGTGLLGRMTFENGFYMDGSLRLGRVENKFHTNDFVGASNHAEYKIKSMYYGAHLGAGYLLTLDNADDLDFYGRILYTRQGGDKTTLTTGERLRFKAIHSERVKLGARYTWTVNDRVKPYAGLAWEHAFGGHSKVLLNGDHALVTSQFKGSSAVGEVGLSINPEAVDDAFTFDFALTGYAGKRQGVSGTAKLTYRF